MSRIEWEEARKGKTKEEGERKVEKGENLEPCLETVLSSVSIMFNIDL